MLGGVVEDRLSPSDMGFADNSCDGFVVLRSLREGVIVQMLAAVVAEEQLRGRSNPWYRRSEEPNFRTPECKRGAPICNPLLSHSIPLYLSNFADER